MAKRKGKARKTREKVTGRIPGMARDATAARTPTPSPGPAGPSNMADRVLSSVMPPTRMRMVVSRSTGPAPRKGKPIKSRRKT
jgi:archaeosine-15-forming tRNA-guanine transglycosylase